MIVSLSLRTRIAPDVWESQTPEAIITAVELIREADDQERRHARQ